MVVEKIKYYWMLQKEESIKTVAYCPNDTFLTLELLDNLSDATFLPFDMELHSVWVENNLIKGEVSDIFSDYLSNNLGCSIVSQRLRSVIDNYRNGTESLHWISVNIKGKSKQYEYFIPFFEKYLDTLDREKTVIDRTTNTIIKPVFDYEKYKQYAIFHSPDYVYWQMSFSLYINENIKKAIIKSGIKDMIFEKI